VRSPLVKGELPRAIRSRSSRMARRWPSIPNSTVPATAETLGHHALEPLLSPARRGAVTHVIARCPPVPVGKRKPGENGASFRVRQRSHGSPVRVEHVEGDEGGRVRAGEGACAGPAAGRPAPPDLVEAGATVGAEADNLSVETSLRSPAAFPSPWSSGKAPVKSYRAGCIW
jgi:hypothetical protein